MKYIYLFIYLFLINILMTVNQVDIIKPIILNYDYHIRLARQHFESSIPVNERPYYAFISFIGIPDQDLKNRINALQAWFPSLTFSSEVDPLEEVPGSDNRLFVFDIRNFGWNRDSLTSVFIRDPYFIEPAINHSDTEWLQEQTFTDYVCLSEEIKEIQKKELHSLVVARADFILRDTFESDRSPSYYDLLFSKQRFHYNRYREKANDGKFYWYFDRKFTDFPKNEAEWESVFGIDVFDKFLKTVKINLNHGAIVEEGISIVARQNRLILRRQGPIGYNYKTFDVDETAGNKDFTETLFYDFDYIAAEFLSQLPGGSFASFLANKAGKRLETADNKLAKDTSDTRMDARVRNPGSCFICHPEAINRPKDHFREFLDKGIDLKVKYKEKMLDIRSFFLNWDRSLKHDQDEYIDFIKKKNGLKPQVNALNYLNARDAYDADLSIEQVAAECGLPVELVKDIGSRSPFGRLQAFVRDSKIPRRTFEKDVYRKIILLHMAQLQGRPIK